MGRYRRILALIAAKADSAAVAQRAVQLSRFYGATLALATVVDPAPGIKSNLAPPGAAEDLRPSQGARNTTPTGTDDDRNRL